MKDIRIQHYFSLLYYKLVYLGLWLLISLPMFSVAQDSIPPLGQLRQTWYSKDKKVTYTQRIEAASALLSWYAYSSRQDSLLTIAQEMLAYGKRSKNPEGIADGFYWIARYHLTQGDMQAAIQTTREAMRQPGQNDSEETYWCYINLGRAYTYWDQLDSAEYYYKKAMINGRKHGRVATDLVFLYDHLAYIYQFQGKYLDAIDGYSKVLNSPDLEYQFDANLSLGRIFQTLGLQDEAKASFHQADLLAQKTNQRHLKLLNCAVQLKVCKNLKEAEKLIQKGLALRGSFAFNRKTLTFYLWAGNYYLDSLKLDQAADFYQRALALSIKIKHTGPKNEALLALAKIHQLQGHTQQSMQICQDIKAALEKNQSPRALATLYEILSNNYEALQQPNRALFYLRQKEAQEVLLNDEGNIKEALSTYIQRKSEGERMALKLAKENAEKLATATRAKARLNNWVFGLLSLFLTGTVLVYYTFYRQKKTSAEQLAQINELLEGEKQKLLASNQKLKRFSGVVSHDILSNLDLILSTGNVLVGARPNTENLNKYYTLTQNTGRQLKDYCLGLLEEAKASSHKALADVGDPNIVLNKVIERFGPALQEKGFAVELGELPNSRLPLSVVEQVLQNLLSNALRYAGGHPNPRLYIGSGIDERGNLCWYVADNGLGQAEAINLAIANQQLNSEKGQGLGLHLLQNTLKDYGWGLKAEAVDGGGIRMVVENSR